MDNKRKYAILAAVTYEKKENRDMILNKLGYNLDRNLSTDERLVLFDEDELIIAIRGSATLTDWSETNAKLIFGLIKRSERWKREKQAFDRIYEKYKGQYKGINLTGHSMAGLICYHLTLENEDKVYNTYMFNSAFSFSELGDQIIKRPFCKFNKDNKNCKAYRKIHIFRDYLDPVSILTSFLPNTTSSISNPHSITNFVGGNIPETLTNEEIRELIKEYHPIHYLHSDAIVFPDSIQNILKNYTKEMRGDKIYMVLNHKIKNASDRPSFIIGNRNLNEVPSYVFLRSHPLGFILEFNVFFNYNVGKNVFNTNFGNHFFDGTRSYIVFNENKEPILIGGQYHNHKNIWQWGNNEDMSKQYNRKGLIQEFENNHPIFYHGQRGSELLPFIGRYTYKSTPLLKLRDYGNKGFRYETGNKYEIIRPENYYGLSNEAEDQNGNKISLSIPEKELDNWSMINFIGREPMGRVKIKGIVDQYRLTSFVHFKPSEYRKWEENDVEIKQYLQKFQ